MNKSAQEVASAWIAKWSQPDPDAGLDGFDLDFDIPRENPNLCLEAILEILEIIPADISNHHFQVLAAGPLEDLLVEHGETYVGRIEELARQRPDFRLLLNGVWNNSINPNVVKQLSKYWGNKW
ncbi:DUF6869 domain-containing protein [Methylotenera mobilis]|uniref:DUF6869 domain-containing protein n=1 Tax=Methylotenera mobilis TaxID=359408 RepID=UPI000378BF46|nr:hypothetical protein [Methylotenera mobilis]